MTHLPIEVSRNRIESPNILFVNGILVTVSGNASFNIAWRRPWGAISIVIALFGICFRTSSNNTLLNRLFVWYSGEEYFARSDSHSDSGKEVLIHFEVLFFGSLITYKIKKNDISTSWRNENNIFIKLLDKRLLSI